MKKNNKDYWSIGKPDLPWFGCNKGEHGLTPIAHQIDKIKGKNWVSVLFEGGLSSSIMVDEKYDLTKEDGEFRYRGKRAGT